MAKGDKKVYSKGALARRERSKKLSKKRPGRKRFDAKIPLLKDKAWLENAYQVENKSLTTIGRELGVSHGVVWAYMKRHGIKLRTRAEAKRTPETKPRKRSPRTVQHTTLEQRVNCPPCPSCGSKQDWYFPLKSDTFLCQGCNTWFDATVVSGQIQLKEATVPIEG